MVILVGFIENYLERKKVNEYLMVATASDIMIFTASNRASSTSEKSSSQKQRIDVKNVPKLKFILFRYIVGVHNQTKWF